MPDYVLPNIVSGGTITVSGNSLQQAQQNAASQTGVSLAAQQGGGTFGINTSNTLSGSNGPSGSSGGGGGGGSNVTSSGGSAGQQLGNIVNGIVGALAAGNQKAFDELVREFDANFGLDQKKFDEAVRQFNQNFGLGAAGLTGTYNGQPTLAALQNAQQNAINVAGLTGSYQAPTLGGPAGTAAGGSNPALAGYQPGAVIRTNGNQFGVVGPNGSVQTGDAVWPQIYAAIQQPGAISTVSDDAFTAGVTLAQRPAPAAAAGTPAAGGQGTPTLASILQNAQLSGMYNGSPTEAAREFNTNAGLNAVQLASQLQANPFRQQQVLGQLGPLLTGQGVAGFSSPNTVAGVGTAGGNTQGGLGYMQQIIDDIRSGGQQNTASMNSVLDAIPTPNKLNSAEFLRSAPSTQQLVLQGIQEKYGIDPNDAFAQIRNTLPQFSSPGTSGTVRV